MSDSEIRITIYRISGEQLFFNVNSAHCRECDLTINVVERVLAEIKDIKVKLKVKPWFNYLIPSLARGGYHPPVLLVENRVVTQGVVPTLEEVKRAILKASERKWNPRKIVPKTTFARDQ